MTRTPAATLLAVLFALPAAPGQAPLPAPRAVPPAPSGQPIDLQTALRLAATSNLDIALARAALDQAAAARQRAVSRTLPNLTGGSTYTDHDGRIQQANGNILNVNRTSLLVAAGPTLSLDFADALFAPLAARQFEQAARAATTRVTNDALLAVADAYLAVLRARRRIARIDEALVFLTAEGPSPLRAGLKGLLPLVRDVVEVGGKDAFRSDVARLQVEVLRRREERAAAVQEYAAASAELARLLRLDPTVGLGPLEPDWAAVPMPGADWAEQGLDALIGFALRNRPELAENEALLRLAVARAKAAHVRPYLPALQFSWQAGGFGGGPVRDPRSKITQPLNGPIDTPVSGTSEIGRFGHRSDLSVTLGWQLQGLGLGNVAELREARAVSRQAQLRLLGTADRVAVQVVQARAAVAQARERAGLAGSALFDQAGWATGPVFESLRLNFDRIRGGEGRPLEALDAIRGLNDMLEAYALALTEYDRARFRLLVALGLPPEALLDPARMPPAPCPPR